MEKEAVLTTTVLTTEPVEGEIHWGDGTLEWIVGVEASEVTSLDLYHEAVNNVDGRGVDFHAVGGDSRGRKFALCVGNERAWRVAEWRGVANDSVHIVRLATPLRVWEDGPRVPAFAVVDDRSDMDVQIVGAARDLGARSRLSRTDGLLSAGGPQLEGSACRDVGRPARGLVFAGTQSGVCVVVARAARWGSSDPALTGSHGRLVKRLIVLDTSGAFHAWARAFNEHEMTHLR